MVFMLSAAGGGGGATLVSGGGVSALIVSCPNAQGTEHTQVTMEAKAMSEDLRISDAPLVHRCRCSVCQ